jgi:hypothetical protein
MVSTPKPKLPAIVEVKGTFTMSDYKNNTISPAAGHEPVNGGVNGHDKHGSTKPGYESTLRNGRVRNLVTPEGRDMGGWDSYRRWLNRVQSPDKRRSPMDPALYTWKGRKKSAAIGNRTSESRHTSWLHGVAGVRAAVKKARKTNRTRLRDEYRRHA